MQRRFIHLTSDISRMLQNSPIKSIIVVGAGHAGIEAAAASSRLGIQTTLITPNFNNVGATSCNPAFGRHRKRYIIKRN